MRRGLLGVLALLVALAAAGCVRVPDSGGIRTSDTVVGDTLAVGVPDIDPEPPAPGASPAEIVRGFLDALQASPVSTSVAQLYLTTQARATWRPEQRIITYASRTEPAGQGVVRVRLAGADRYDGTGTWRGAVTGAAATLSFRVVQEAGEYRIVDPPNALVVVRSWFDPRFTRAALYFFDPTARTFVPEPVVVPVGEARPGTLVRGLLRGPDPRLHRGEQTFLPAGLQLALSVPVSRTGLATVGLKGTLPPMSDQQTTLMFAQIAQTLAQDPRIQAVQVSVDGVVVRPPGGTDRFPVASAAAFDGSRVDAGGVLYGLRQGRLVSGPPTSLDPLDGPLGTGAVAPPRAVAADVAGTTVAAVSADGTALVTAPARAGTGVPVRTVVAGARDLLRPSWTAAGRLWVVDRDGGAARVLTQGTGSGGGVEEVRVPGVTGQDVVRALTSRDGTRLVALLATPGGGRVVVSRVIGAADGRVVRAQRARTVLATPAGTRLRDVAWFGDTALAVLTQQPGQLAQVATLGIDGSPAGDDGLVTTVADAVTLLGSPDPRQPFYAVTRSGLVDLSPAGGGFRIPLDGVRSLGYGG